MRAVVDHAGARWTLRAPAESWAIGLILGGGLSGGATLGWLALGWLPWLAWLPLLVLVPVIYQLVRATTIAVTDRAVLVEERAGLRRQRHRLPLDVLRARLVEPHEGTSGDPLLVLVADDDQLVLGRGQPREHLAWLLEAIEVAQGAYAARERAEGREWGFLRKAPEALQRLRGDEPER